MESKVEDTIAVRVEGRRHDCRQQVRQQPEQPQMCECKSKECTCKKLCCALIVFVVIVVIAVIVFANTWGGVPAGCFSADSRVWIKKRNMLDKGIDEVLYQQIRDIKIGDYVLSMNPLTNELFWDEVEIKIHYSWYDDANSYVPMRRLYLDNNNTSSITLSYDHFVYINDILNNKPKVIQSGLVEIGDNLFYYDYDNKLPLLWTVTEIEENVQSQKRSFHTISPYILVNNIVASTYPGPHPMFHTILHKIMVKTSFTRSTKLARMYEKYIEEEPIYMFIISMVSQSIYLTLCFLYHIIVYWFEFSVIIIIVFWFIVFKIINNAVQHQKKKKNQ